MKKALILICLCMFIVSCGGGGSSSPLTDLPSSSTSPSSASTAPSSEKLLGNFMFVFTIDQVLQDLITIDHKGTTQTMDGTDIYLGHNTTYPDIGAAGAWYPSINKYLIAEEFNYSNGNKVDTVYAFVIEGDKRLTGCMQFSVNNGNYSPCYSLDSSVSRKTARMSAQTAPSNTIWEEMALMARESNGAASDREEDADMKAKMAELQAVIRLSKN